MGIGFISDFNTGVYIKALRFCCGNSVSYTHLDVYKRQALSKASTQWRGHAVFATLMREENVYIAIEDRNHNRLALLYDIADMTEGKCQAVRCLTESDFLVTGQGAKGPRAILCTPADNGGYQIAADEYASAEATPRCV